MEPGASEWIEDLLFEKPAWLVSVRAVLERGVVDPATMQLLPRLGATLRHGDGRPAVYRVGTERLLFVRVDELYEACAQLAYAHVHRLTAAELARPLDSLPPAMRGTLPAGMVDVAACDRREFPELHSRRRPRAKSRTAVQTPARAATREPSRRRNQSKKPLS